jgi:hypothetical protein
MGPSGTLGLAETFPALPPPGPTPPDFQVLLRRRAGCVRLLVGGPQPVHRPGDQAEGRLHQVVRVARAHGGKGASLMRHSCVTHASLMRRSCVTHASLMHHSCVTQAQAAKAQGEGEGGVAISAAAGGAAAAGSGAVPDGRDFAHYWSVFDSPYCEDDYRAVLAGVGWK